MSNARNKWLSMLADLTYPQNPEQAAKAFKAFLPMLADIPDGAFTVSSLDAVCASPRKMAIPSYDEIRKPLSVWWRDHRPVGPALSPPAEPAWTPPAGEEKAAAAMLVGKAKAHLAEAVEQRERGTKQHPVRARHLTETQLLEIYEAQAKQPGLADGLRQCAVIRAQTIRAKLAAEMPQREAAA